jgi:hypothetical protein
VSSVIASHLVLSALVDDADPDVVISRTADLLHPRSREALAEHVGNIRLTRADDVDTLPIPAVPLLRSAGPVPAGVEPIIEAPAQGWSVLLRTSESEAVSAQYAARAAAALLAYHADGVGLDLMIPRMWPRLDPAADPDRTADWFVFERLGDDDSEPATQTRGLSRFGLPELRVGDAAGSPAWDAVLTGLAHRLVTTESPEPPTEIDLGLSDIAAGYAEPVDPDDPTLRRRTTLALTYTDGIAEVSGSIVADLFTG